MLFAKRPGSSRPTPAKKLAREEREHLVAGRALPLTVTRNPRAKRLTLRIDRGGASLSITVPPSTPRREVESFLLRQREWLEDRLAKLPVRPRLRAGVKLPVRGVPHRIEHAGGRGGVSIRDGEGGPLLLVHGAAESLPRRLADFLKREARAEIVPLVEKHCAALGCKAKALRFRDTSSRWGSCSSAGVLSFSWRIMMAPRPVIDYLVAHEVAHLKEMNHGSAFWALCEKLCPDTERCKGWLRKNGAALQAIGFE